MAVDLLLKQNSDTKFFDLSIKDGDFESVNNFDTSIIVSLFSDKRADASEVGSSHLRRGWWGDLFNDDPTFQSGSKLWLLDQARLTENILNSAIDYARNSLQWLVDDNLADNIQVTGILQENGIRLNIVIFRGQSKVFNRFFDLWQNSGNI